MNDPRSNNRELIAVRIRAPKPDGSPYGSPLWVPSPCRSSLLRTSRPTTGRNWPAAGGTERAVSVPGPSGTTTSLLATSKSETLLLRRDQGDVGSVVGLPALPVVALTRPVPGARRCIPLMKMGWPLFWRPPGRRRTTPCSTWPYTPACVVPSS